MLIATCHKAMGVTRLWEPYNGHPLDQGFFTNLVLDAPTIALMEMANVKSLGFHGFLCEFYKATWDFVEPDLL
jgi:hypothetical protein